ncbi:MULTISPECIES: hypothetical protein [unclassified Chryseobacterium]|uniref:hypothetical protein n=1 Tax=unclassified Chryseobacterium TaxID=2593645 RepID=UPI00100B90AA|nr:MULTISPECIES: hypothetical protein [unclassified Chryseobacterium]RXM51893.1 hypothetical protein BOQ64_08445 [Chryseobacterium sp. CH25]RXM63812.1 hypothetical protein BOQ60_12805 [Chryseobacterium sp. CH1]
MERLTHYIKSNWLLLSIGGLFMSLFVYLTFTGNQFCDCAKTEKYRDGTTKSHSRAGFYRYYHK